MDSREKYDEGLRKRADATVSNLLESASPEKRSLSLLEKDAYDEAHRRELSETKLQSLKDDIRAKKKMTYLIFYMVLGWLIAILAILVLSGLENWSFKLSDAVLIALLGSTTVNVTAFFLVVTKYLFPPGKE
jgi:hypothetical protein